MDLVVVRVSRLGSLAQIAYIAAMVGQRKSTEDQIEAVEPTPASFEPESAARRQSKAISAQVDRLRNAQLDHLSNDGSLFQRLVQINGALYELPSERHYTIAGDVAALTHLVKLGLERRQAAEPERKAYFQRRIEELDIAGFTEVTNQISRSDLASSLQHDAHDEPLKEKPVNSSEVNHGNIRDDNVSSGDKLGSYIDENLQPQSRDSLQARLEKLEQFAVKNAGHGIAEYVRQHFPEMQALEPEQTVAGCAPLPDFAPEIYQGLRGPETPPAFVQRVYAPWLGQGLTRAHIRKLDPKLSIAINNWLSRPGNEWPPDVDLPTVKEQNDRWVERVRADGLAGAVDGASGEEALRIASRFRGALHRRKER